MKKILGIAALILAFTPFAQAEGLPGHEDARNDRQMESFDAPAHHVAKRVHHVKHHVMHHEMHHEPEHKM